MSPIPTQIFRYVGPFIVLFFQGCIFLNATSGTQFYSDDESYYHKNYLERCILQMVVSDASDTAVFVAFDTTMTQLYLNLPVEAHTIQFLYKTSEMYYLKHLRSPPAQPLDDFSAQQGGNNHPDNDIPGAGSKVKSCTDVKNNVPVNMRCCNNGGALNGYARKLFRMRSLLFLPQPPNFHGLLMTDLLGRRPGLIRLAAF
ncbi:unnamed protein product [Brassica oleracea var. botrytis]|uniref:(rape) hypothetical protein n=1 Tax=Brassica napus TaxID=3708 RepID=A0A816IF05_BRANA|nr:unnamed protein product [Brassica napus]